MFDLSDRQLEEAVRDRLSFRWFVGLDAMENVPDHTAYCRFREPEGVTADKGYDSEENIEDIRDALKKKRPSIEHKFAEGKKYHGMGRARYWGLDKMRIQVFMTAIAINLKRMVRLTFGIPRWQMTG